MAPILLVSHRRNFSEGIPMMVMSLLKIAVDAYHLPRVQISLMREKARENDDFYLRLVDSFYKDSLRRHRKFPLISAFAVGVALYDLRAGRKPYIEQIEASGRRNVKKAQRQGYRFNPIRFNDHLSDIKEIRQSTDIRQGPMPDSLLHSEVRPISDPPTRNDFHRYDYFGVLREGKLYAYAGCFSVGEVCIFEQILGHARFHSDGIVPLLICGVANHVAQFSHIRYLCYGTTFGGSQSLQRFKKKFLFFPHNVTWVLDSPGQT